MKYRRLGQTGLFVSELCFGAMTFGGRGFWTVVGQLGQEEADRLVFRALDEGVNFFDTADVYSEGESERLLGKALGTQRKHVVLATKVRGRAGPGPNDVGLSRGHIMASIDASLQRLGTDYIDLYQIHGFDPLTPFEETLRALDDIVRMGKVRYIGCSNLAAWQIMKSLGLSTHHGWARFDSLQAYYSIAGRDLEREIVPLLIDQGLGLMVWSPLAGGLLSGKFKQDGSGPEGSRRASFDFPPVDKDARLSHHRRHAGHRPAKEHLGASRCPRLAARSKHRNHRHYWRQNPRAARRQSGSHRRNPRRKRDNTAQ